MSSKGISPLDTKAMIGLKDILPVAASKLQVLRNQGRQASSTLPPENATPLLGGNEGESELNSNNEKHNDSEYRSDSIFRTEFNIEKWAPFLFLPPKSPEIYNVRAHQWTNGQPLISAKGEELKQLITVTPQKDGRSYTTWTYLVYQSVLQYWVNQGMIGNKIDMTLREIARGMKVKGSSFNAYWANLISEEVFCLRDTGIKWEYCYQLKPSSDVPNALQQDGVHRLESLDSFSIFSRVRYTKLKGRLQGVKYSSSTCSITLDENLADNLRNGLTIPVNTDSINQLRNEDLFIFLKADLFLAHKSGRRNAIKFRVSNLMFGKNGLGHSESSVYKKHKSKRGRWAKRKAQKLNGLPTSSPGILHVRIEETKDKQDWNIVLWKEAVFVPSTPDLPILNNKQEQDFLYDRIVQAIGQAVQNKKLYKRLASHYSRGHIEQALGRMNEIEQSGVIVKSKPAFFTDQMHVIAHERNRQWINYKTCKGETCDKNKKK